MKRSNTSERLQQIMSERKLRQVDILNAAKPFCEKYNVKLGKNDLSQYVGGKVEPGQEKLTILGLALGVNEVWLMGYDVPKNRPEKDTDTVVNNISQYQAILAWILDSEDVSDEIKFVIREELPEDSMDALAALSYQAGAQTDRGIKKLPTLISKDGQPVNIIKIAGRDGSYMEKQLGDKELQTLKSFIDLLPDASDDL